MSLEEALKEHTTAIRELVHTLKNDGIPAFARGDKTDKSDKASVATPALAAPAAALAPETKQSEPSAPASTKKATKAATKKAEAAAAGTPAEKLAELVNELAEKDLNKAVEILGQFGVTKARFLKPDQVQPAHDAFAAALAAMDEAGQDSGSLV